MALKAFSCLLAVLLLSSGVFAVKTQPRPAPRALPPRSVNPLPPDRATEQLFEEALRHIWMISRAGLEEYEAGFALDRVGDHYQIVYAPLSYERNMELQIPLDTVGITVAIAHTHPNSGEDHPSGADGHGDTFSPVPNFVVSRSGVWVTDPVAHRYYHLRGPGWPRPYSAALLTRSAALLAAAPAQLPAPAPAVARQKQQAPALDKVRSTLPLGLL